MPANSFHLIGPVFSLTDIEFKRLLSISIYLSDIDYLQPHLKPDSGFARLTIKDKTFRNVNLSKKTITRMHFYNCTFNDCLFFGTTFEQCEFHNCQFMGCNMWKISVSQSYFDPSFLTRNFPSKNAANIASDCFQELFKNAKDEHLEKHAEKADYHYRKWERRNLLYKLETNKISILRFAWKFFWDLMYQNLLGYGYGLKNLFLTSAGIFIIFCGVNYVYWDSFVTVLPDYVQFNKSIDNVIFLTFRNMTAFDFAGFYPLESCGKYLSIIQGLFGYVLLGCLISLVFKKLSK